MLKLKVSETLRFYFLLIPEKSKIIEKKSKNVDE
jgi:hypothetical protein